MLKLCCSAVAAMSESIAAGALSRCCTAAIKRPHRSATSASNERTRPANCWGRLFVSHASRRAFFAPSVQHSVPLRISPSVTTLMYTCTSSTSRSHAAKPRSGRGFVASETAHVSIRNPLKRRPREHRRVNDPGRGQRRPMGMTGKIEKISSRANRVRERVVRNNDYCIPPVFRYALGLAVDRALHDFAKLRFRVLQLPAIGGCDCLPQS